MSQPTVIIQARLSSSRLPGKVMLPLAGRPIISHVYHRCAKAGYPTVVAIPATQANDELASFLHLAGIPAFRSDRDENDVAGRYLDCANLWDADPIIRVCGDQPLVDPEAITHTTELMRENEIYLSNGYTRTGENYRHLPYGLVVDVFWRQGLKLIQDFGSVHDREHITTFFRRKGHCGFVETHPKFSQEPWHSWVLDTPEDYAWLKKLESHVVFDPHQALPTPQMLLELFKEKPQLVRLQKSPSPPTGTAATTPPG